MKRRDPYRWLTPIYSFLAKLVYGKSLRKAEAFCCQYIRPKQQVLVMGGGDGDILSLLPKGTKVDYVDFSPSMLKRASRKVPVNVQFTPHCEDVLKYAVAVGTYDAVLFPYLLDLFSSEEVWEILTKGKQALKPGGFMGIADFEASSIWQKGLLQSMYWFFGLLTGLKTRALAPYKKIATEIGLELQEEASFYGGFVKACIFRAI